MNYTFNTQNKQFSSFKSEDYFPAIIQFSSEELNNRFVEFSFQDTDMFELVGSSKTGIIKQFTFTLCNHYEELKENMNVPIATEGTMILNNNDSIKCEKFIAYIYDDGIKIDISGKDAIKYFKCGQLIFAFDEMDSLTSLFVTDLSSNEISHVLHEVHQE